MSSWYITYNSSDDLMHYGVLGQRWGIRRFQNPDGSLTEKGKRRYGRALEKDQKAIEKAKAGLDKKNKIYFGKGFIIKNHKQTGLERRMDKALLRNDMDSYKKMAKVQYKGKSAKAISKMAKERYSRLVSDRKSKIITAAAAGATVAAGLAFLNSSPGIRLASTAISAISTQHYGPTQHYEPTWHYDVFDPSTGMPIPQYY